MLSFDNLPIAALINKSFFCVHGGLSPDLTSLEEVKTMDRFQEIPREGPMVSTHKTCADTNVKDLRARALADVHV